MYDVVSTFGLHKLHIKVPSAKEVHDPYTCRGVGYPQLGGGGALSISVYFIICNKKMQENVYMILNPQPLY